MFACSTQSTSCSSLSATFSLVPNLYFHGPGNRHFDWFILWHRAYDSVCNSNFLFLLGWKRSYDSDSTFMGSVRIISDLLFSFFMIKVQCIHHVQLILIIIRHKRTLRYYANVTWALGTQATRGGPGACSPGKLRCSEMLFPSFWGHIFSFSPNNFLYIL